MCKRLGALTLGLAMWLLTGGASAQSGQTRRPPMPQPAGLMFNQDDSDFFFSHAIREGVDGGALLDQYLDLMAEAGVKVFLCCTNARKTNYRSEVWEAYWDGYDPQGPDDQPHLAPIPPEQRAGWRRLMHSAWALHQQGLDYPAYVAAGCRQRGMSPWITLRMNDVHENHNLAHPFHGAIFREAKYHRGGEGYYARGLDYAHPAVRDYYRALVVETLQRYDTDGLELDFMREPYLFRPGQEEAGAKLLREWLRGLRRLVHDASVRRGHPILLGVRVPSRVEVARGWGLDAIGWAREGLVDVIVPTPRWATLEYDMPLDEWRRQLAGTGVFLAGGLEILYRPHPGGEARGVSPELAAGAATAVLSAGAQAVYLFNYFGGTIGSGDWTRESYCRTLGAMNSLEALTRLPRRHAVTYRDILGPGEAYHYPLPAEGRQLTFALPTGPAPAPGTPVTVEVTLAAAAATPPTVTVNQQPADFQSARKAEAGASVLTYEVPVSALTGQRRNQVAISTADAQSLRVVGLEICLPSPR